MAAPPDRSIAEMLVAEMRVLGAFIHRQVRDRDLTSEVLQEVSLRVLSGDPPRDREAFVRWACGIARHVIACEWHRRARARQGQSLDDDIANRLCDPVPTPDRRIAARDVLLSAIGDDEETFALLSRRYLQSFSTVEMAREAGLTSAAIRMRIWRIRASARARAD
jgi:DNA-directed RNA polymerase specialized sigma24 family protein